MPHEQQLLLGFACLDFSGRSTVTLQEIATKLGISCDTLERQVDDGTLTALDLARHQTSRRLLRIPVDEYRRYVAARLTGPARRQFLAELPTETLREIAREIAARLAA